MSGMSEFVEFSEGKFLKYKMHGGKYSCCEKQSFKDKLIGYDCPIVPQDCRLDVLVQSFI